MKWLKILISVYIVGLITFYTYATFDRHIWDVVYFGWAKIADIGILGWGTIYYNLPMQKRNIVVWLLCFSIVRFLWDIQSFFTNIGVNNSIGAAALFLFLILIVSVFTLIEFKRLNR